MERRIERTIYQFTYTLSEDRETKTMRVTSGTINDNPWEGVERDEEEPMMRSSSSSPPQPQRTTTTNWRQRLLEQRRRHFTCTDWTLHSLVQGFLGLDVFGCLFWLIYGLVLLVHHSQQQKTHNGNDNSNDDEDDSSNSTLLYEFESLDSVPTNGSGRASMLSAVLHSAQVNSVWPTVLALELSLWLGLRVLSVTAALYYSHVVNLCGLLMASYISATLGAQTVLMSLLAAIYGKGPLNQVSWWRTHFLLKSQNSRVLHQWFFDELEPWLWLLLLVLAILEFPIRYYVYHQYRQRLLQQEQDDLRQTALLSRAATQRRPWWWSSNSFAHNHRPSSDHPNPLQQALLDDFQGLPSSRAQQSGGDMGLPDWVKEENDSNYQQNQMVAQQQQQQEDQHLLLADMTQPDATPVDEPSSSNSFLWSWVSSWTTSRRRRSLVDGGSNLRDDGSVDFASVQEEWASRTEEDPVWWSRGGGAPPPSSSASASPQRQSKLAKKSIGGRSKGGGMTNPQEGVPEFVNTDTDSHRFGGTTTSTGSVVSEI